MTKTDVRVYQMDSKKARQLGIYKFFEWELEGEKIQALGTVKEAIAKIYTQVYELDGFELSDDNLKGLCDAIFKLSNQGKLVCWRGHSMSMSDIVEICGRFFYCDECGWTELNF